jgi:hypothetical protein
MSDDRKFSWGKVFGILGLGLLVYLVANIGPTTRRWTEDVVFDDGSSIVVKRTVTFRETNALGGGAHNTIEQEATIAFTGDLAALPRWSFPLMGMVMYRDATRNGQWVIVATTTTCAIWSTHGAPRPPYWEFRLTSAGWQEVLLSATSMNRPNNLFENYNVLKKSHVTSEYRVESHRGASDHYKTVLRASNVWYCSPTTNAPQLPWH